MSRNRPIPTRHRISGCSVRPREYDADDASPGWSDDIELVRVPMVPDMLWQPASRKPSIVMNDAEILPVLSAPAASRGMPVGHGRA